MLARLRRSYSALTPRNRTLLLVALGLSVLLVLNRTVIAWVMDYSSAIDSRVEDLEAQVEKIGQKLASRTELETRKAALQSRLQREREFLLPYASPNEAQNMLNACLQNLAVKTQVELANVQTRPVVELGENYQKVSVLARTSARTQNWTRFLYEVEALRQSGPSADGAEYCPALPLTVDELTIRVLAGKNQHDANVMFLVSGIIRKPDAGGAGDGKNEGALRSTPARGRG